MSSMELFVNSAMNTRARPCLEVQSELLFVYLHRTVDCRVVALVSWHGATPSKQPVMNEERMRRAIG